MKSTFGTGSWFVDTFNGWCRTLGCQRTLLDFLDEEAGSSQASSVRRSLAALLHRILLNV